MKRPVEGVAAFVFVMALAGCKAPPPPASVANGFAGVLQAPSIMPAPDRCSLSVLLLGPKADWNYGPKPTIARPLEITLAATPGSVGKPVEFFIRGVAAGPPDAPANIIVTIDGRRHVLPLRLVQEGDDGFALSLVETLSTKSDVTAVKVEIDLPQPATRKRLPASSSIRSTWSCSRAANARADGPRQRGPEGRRHYESFTRAGAVSPCSGPSVQAQPLRRSRSCRSVT